MMILSSPACHISLSVAGHVPLGAADVRVTASARFGSATTVRADGAMARLDASLIAFGSASTNPPLAHAHSLRALASARVCARAVAGPLRDLSRISANLWSNSA